MHDFGDLGRALEMVALLPGVALGGEGEDPPAVNGSCEMTRPRHIDRSRFGSLHLVAEQCCVLARAFPHRRARCLAAQAWAPHRHQHRLGDYLRAQKVARDMLAPGYRNICPLTALCG